MESLLGGGTLGSSVTFIEIVGSLLRSRALVQTPAMRNRPTRLFLRFRDRGDGAAFAQLFDLVAPDFLAVAVRLAPDVATGVALL